MKILADCDGVLLDWEKAFHQWMQIRGHQQTGYDTYNISSMYEHVAQEEAKRLVTEFNGTSWMLGLEPMRDAIAGVHTLLHHGYHFDVITSLSLDPYAKQARDINLSAHFGQGAIDELICLDTGAEKHDALSKYEGTGYWWIEDKPENCDVGLEFDLKPILIDHPHNRWYNNSKVIRVADWSELCKVVLSA
jgi:hypothetical protein